MDQQSLNQRHHVVFRHKGHFQVQLGKFRLAVRALIFVAETACYLEVAIHTSHHQQLLQLLRRLWQSIELAWIEPAWHEIVTCALRCAFHQNGCLDLQETALIQVITYGLDHAMTQYDIVSHLGTAQVKVAIFEPERLIHLYFVADRKRCCA